MADNRNSCSGMQSAADLARAAKAVYRVVRAAAASGVYGAAAAAAKEAFPFLVKLLIGIVVVAVVVPMVVFAALPNIFFGFHSSDTDAVVRMTEQAMSVGGVYMSLEDFEKHYIDSVVAAIVADYEAQGVIADRVTVNNFMEEEDLLWLIAINSVACRQDLDAMSPELIHELCRSSISWFPSLGTMNIGDDRTLTTLSITIERIDPKKLMEKLNFDEDARLWAEALFETMEESDAINRYGPYFAAVQADGDGEIQ